MNNEQVSLFGLTKHELKALLFAQSWLTQLDVESSIHNQMLYEKKSLWLRHWQDSLFVKRSLFGMLGDKVPTQESEIIVKLNAIKDKDKRCLVLCELLVYTPYYNLQIREIAGLKEALKEENSKTSRLEWENNVKRLAEAVGVEADILLRWKDSYLASLKDIGGKRSELLKGVALIAVASFAAAITGGMAAPAIGSMVGGLMGLSGAAATSAGLAFLGGGAIATGGFGIAGGTVAIIGGGAILGGVGTGSAVLKNYWQQDKVTLSQLAKFEATLVVIYWFSEKCIEIMDHAIDMQISVINEMQVALEEADEDISNYKALKKSLSYYKESVKRLNNLRLKRKGLI